MNAVIYTKDDKEYASMAGILKEESDRLTRLNSAGSHEMFSMVPRDIKQDVPRRIKKKPATGWINHRTGLMKKPEKIKKYMLYNTERN